MYLYLGQATVVLADEIVGIFDMDNTTQSRVTRQYLAAAQKKGVVVAVSPDLPKSFVVCEKNGKTTVYISQISPATLKKRSRYVEGIANL